MKYLLLLLPLVANAGELQLACNLERSKAEVQASTLASPSLYGSLGQDPITTSKSAIAGVTQSFSGRSQARKIREAAEARCDALRSTLQLDEHARWSQAQVQRAGAMAELRIVEQAILLAKANIAELDAQLAAQTITISQHTEARQSLVALETKQAELMRELSVATVAPLRANIANLLEASRLSEARAARLAAEAQAEAGWDVSVQAGVRQPLDGGKPNTYSNITFRWSFGSGASQAAARDVGLQTELLLAAQQGGYTQTVLRQISSIQALIQAETAASATAARQEIHLRRVRASIVGIDTALALNTLRSLDLQLKVLEADKVGAETRLTGYRNLLDQLK